MIMHAAALDLQTPDAEATHECAPHWNDNWGGWTNCWVCFAVIRVLGPLDGRCQVIVPWTGRCDLKVGHTGRHSINGVLFTARATT